MNMNLSPRRVWINSNAQHAHQSIWLHIHRWKHGIPLQNAQTRFIHMWKFFTAFSRVFHGLFTSFSRSFHIFGFCIVRVFFCCSFCGNHEDMTFTPPTIISDQTHIKQARLQPPSFKPVAPWQVAGNISFYSYLIRCNVVQNRCTSFCYAIMMLMGGLGYSWITPATIWWFASCFFWFVFILLIRLKSDF